MPKSYFMELKAELDAAGFRPKFALSGLSISA